MAKLTRILSIDGGGIRGIIPAQVLISLEKKLQERTVNPGARLADFFDLVAGTSTGGILTCIYLCPDVTGNPTRPRFTAEEARDLYLTKGGKIFDLSIWQMLTSGAGVLDEKYSAGSLEKELESYLGELKLSDLLKPTLITAYDIERRCAKFFTRHDAVEKKSEDYYLREVARATSAAPTYFEPKDLKSFSGTFYALIDGGVFANNPALCAYAEARMKLPGHPKTEDMAMLSIGTGYVKKEYPFKDAKDWGLLEWAKPVIDIMMTGVSETVDYQLRRIFEAAERPGQYLRIDGKIKNATPDLDEASAANLRNLEKDGKRISREFEEQLDGFLKYLVE